MSTFDEKNALIRMAFTHLTWAMDNSHQSVYDEQKDPGLTDLVEIYSNLLPLMRKQIDALLSTFETIDFENGPVPELSLFPTVAALQHTIERTSVAVFSITLRPDQPALTEDRDCKIFKLFRCKRLLSDTYDLQCLLHYFLERCRDLVQGTAPDQQPIVEDTGSEEKEDWQCAVKKEMKFQATRCTVHIDGMVKRFKRSDLGLIQESWEETIDDLSFTISALQNGFPEREPYVPRDPDVTAMMRTVIALYKVFRVFYRKLSNYSTNKLPFALKEVSSDDMELIIYKTRPPLDFTDDFLDQATVIYQQNRIEGSEIMLSRQIVRAIRRDFQEGLDCLKSYLVTRNQPAHSESPPQFDFDAYFRDVVNQFHSTLDNFLNIVDGPNQMILENSSYGW